MEQMAEKIEELILNEEKKKIIWKKCTKILKR